MTMRPMVITSERLGALPGVRHGFFTRCGGVSTGIYASLNVGLGSSDNREAVVENRRRAAAHFGAPAEALSIAYQTHSTTVATIDTALAGQRRDADGVATASPGVVCGALAADCAPVLMADAQAGVVAAVHAGWRGALGGVVASAVSAMAGLGAAPERIVAAIGPCIGPQSYEVGLEFMDRFVDTSPGAQRYFTNGASPAKRLFDLPGFVLQRLQEAGVTKAEWVGRDTVAEPELFFSNRRAFHEGEADYGRLLSAIMIA